MRRIRDGAPADREAPTMRVGQARKRDANEEAIIDALEDIGATVLRISGPGVPDLLVYLRGAWTPVEVKQRGGSLTARQEALNAYAPYAVVESVEDALALFGVRT